MVFLNSTALFSGLPVEYDDAFTDNTTERVAGSNPAPINLG